MVQERSDEGDVRGELDRESDSDTVVIVDGLEIPSELYRRVVAAAGHDDADEWITEAIKLRFDAEEADGEPSRYGAGEYGIGGYGSKEKGEEN